MNLKLSDYKEKLTGLSIIEISGESCANCFSMMSLLLEVIDGFQGVNLFHIELDEKNKEFIEIFKIERIPTILVLEDTKEIARCTGFQPKEILEIWLDSKLNRNG